MNSFKALLNASISPDDEGAEGPLGWRGLLQGAEGGTQCIFPAWHCEYRASGVLVHLRSGSCASARQPATWHKMLRAVQDSDRSTLRSSEIV